MFDGVLLAAIAGGILSDLKFALIFGISVFSGAGCIGIAATLKRRYIVLAYSGVAVVSVTTAVLSHVLEEILFPYFYLFSALLLITLGLEFLGKNAFIRPGEVAKVGFAITLIYSALHIPGSLSMDIELRVIGNVLFSVFAGFLTTTIGSYMVSKYLDVEILRKISGLILVVLGMGTLQHGGC